MPTKLHAPARRARRFTLKPIAAALLGALALPVQAADHGEFTGLGFLPGGTWSEASDVSADGSVVVGESFDGLNYRAFRWTSGGGMSGLGFLPGAPVGAASGASGASADGSVVVGL